MKHEKAMKIANRFIKRLERHCHRIEIAGSLRREVPEVKDIELVVQPLGKAFSHFVPFETVYRYPIYRYLDKLRSNSQFKFLKDGNKFKQIAILNKHGEELIKIDLFLVVFPDQFGCVFLIRTGPADFSKWIVNYRKPYYTFEKNQLWHHFRQDSRGTIYSIKDCLGEEKILKKERLVTPEEKDVFSTLKIPALPPNKRNDWKKELSMCLDLKEFSLDK